MGSNIGFWVAEKSPVRSASVIQVRQPIYDRSIGRWRQFESHLAPLFAAMGLGEGG